jgi:hypothetical protein
VVFIVISYRHQHLSLLHRSHSSISHQLHPHPSLFL